MNALPCSDHARQDPRTPWRHKPDRPTSAQRYGAGWSSLARRVKTEEHACGICGGPGLPDDVVDHKTPRSQGGTNDRANLQRAHRECNKAKAKRERRASVRVHA